MSSIPRNVPTEFESEVELVSTTDTRTDAEILASLECHYPVTDERNLWAFWHTGVTTMPAWCQRNVVDWVRICSPEWTIRVVDNVPASPNYALKFVASSTLPECFVNRTMNGTHPAQHASDIIRCALVFNHGGVYLDVGHIMLRHINRVCWDVLMDPNNPYNVCVPVWQSGMAMASSFIAARKGDPFIEAWQNIFTHLWRGRTEAAGILDQPLITALGLRYTYQGLREGGLNIDSTVSAIASHEYLNHIIAGMRLVRLDPPGTPSDPTPFSPAKYWGRHVFILHNGHEMFPIEAQMKLNTETEVGSGQAVFDILSTPVDANAPQDERQRTAHDAVWKALARGSLQKVNRAKNLTTQPMLGTLLDGQKADDWCGTYAELLRWGAVHTRQTRPSVRMREPRIPRRLIKKGILESGEAVIVSSKLV